MDKNQLSDFLFKNGIFTSLGSASVERVDTDEHEVQTGEEAMGLSMLFGLVLLG